jgi:predicted ATPase
MILTPDQRLRVFVSSTLGELAAERAAVRATIEKLRLAPVMFEMGARPHPPRALYRAYLEQSHVFLGIYDASYGWVAPDMDISGLEDELRLSGERPKLVYVRDGVPDRDPRLTAMLAHLDTDPSVRVRGWSDAEDLSRSVADDLAALLADQFLHAGSAAGAGSSSGPARATPGDTFPAIALPVPTTSIVGREEQIAAVAELVRRPDVRLVTLTGLGGIGKSRLALEVAWRVTDSFPGGVVLVSLNDIPEPGLVISSIASRLGIRLDTTRPAVDTVVDALSERGELLLLLDGAEHVSDAADDIATLVATCPALTVLVTSRSRIRLAAEHDVVIPPLGVGAPEETAGFGVTGVDPATLARAAEGSDAVRLFLDRAAAARPGADLSADSEQLAAVVELCRRMDGLPLGIEIAAARTRLVPPTALLERLEGSLDLPTARIADLPARQQTLRATLDWSHDLLTPVERDLLAQLSTFAGGASLDAVEQVVRLDAEVLEVLATLADHSLLEVDATVLDAPRFTMLEVVREYAREQLDGSGRCPAVDGAHRDWVRALAHRAQVALKGPGHAEWLERLELESANIRVAGSRADADGDPETLVDLGYSLWLWLWARHHTWEARSWLEQPLTHLDRLTPVMHARLLWIFAGAGVEQGDNELAVRMLADATARFTELADREGLALCAFLDASLAPLQGEHERAIAVFSTLEPELLALDNPFVASICASTAGMILAQQGRFEQAGSMLDRGLAHAESIDNAMLRGTAYGLRGFAFLGRGRLDEAGADFSAGARWAHQAQNPEGLSFACDGLAAVLLARGDRGTDAAVLVGAAHGLRDRVGIVPWPGLRPVMAAIADGVKAATEPGAYEAAYHRGRHLDSNTVRDLCVRIGDQAGAVDRR